MAENGEILKQILTDVRSTREGQIRIETTLGGVKQDVAKLYATVIEGEGSQRPLKSRVDSLEDSVTSLRRKVSPPIAMPALEPYRPQMPSETTGAVAAVKNGGRWKWIVPIAVAIIGTAGGVVAALLAP